MSVNARQIIPVFTIVWHDKPKEQKEKNEMGIKTQLASVVLVPFQNLERAHDEATTSDYGGDIGNEFDIASGSNEYSKEAGN
jgi:hypothetical protein